jgi:hypothetical protein
MLFILIRYLLTCNKKKILLHCFLLGEIALIIDCGKHLHDRIIDHTQTKTT